MKMNKKIIAMLVSTLMLTGVHAYEEDTTVGFYLKNIIPLSEHIDIYELAFKITNNGSEGIKIQDILFPSANVISADISKCDLSAGASCQATAIISAGQDYVINSMPIAVHYVSNKDSYTHTNLVHSEVSLDRSIIIDSIVNGADIYDTAKKDNSTLEFDTSYSTLILKNNSGKQITITSVSLESGVATASYDKTRNVLIASSSEAAATDATNATATENNGSNSSLIVAPSSSLKVKMTLGWAGDVHWSDEERIDYVVVSYTDADGKEKELSLPVTTVVKNNKIVFISASSTVVASGLGYRFFSGGDDSPFHRFNRFLFGPKKPKGIVAPAPRHEDEALAPAAEAEHHEAAPDPVAEERHEVAPAAAVEEHHEEAPVPVPAPDPVAEERHEAAPAAASEEPKTPNKTKRPTTEKIDKKIAELQSWRPKAGTPKKQTENTKADIAERIKVLRKQREELIAAANIEIARVQAVADQRQRVTEAHGNAEVVLEGATAEQAIQQATAEIERIRQQEAARVQQEAAAQAEQVRKAVVAEQRRFVQEAGGNPAVVREDATAENALVAANIEIARAQEATRVQQEAAAQAEQAVVAEQRRRVTEAHGNAEVVLEGATAEQAIQQATAEIERIQQQEAARLAAVAAERQRVTDAHGNPNVVLETATAENALAAANAEIERIRQQEAAHVQQEAAAQAEIARATEAAPVPATPPVPNATNILTGGDTLRAATFGRFSFNWKT